MIEQEVANEALLQMRTQDGQSLIDLSQQQAILLIFLRHFGCTFCREALSDIAKKRQEIEETGTKIVFVHMSDNKLAERYFSRYDLIGIDHISDPECKYYAAFGLMKGSVTQLFGLKTWIRGFEAGVLNGHLVGVKQMGDGFQMPGVFVIQNAVIKNSYIHKIAADRPDYTALVGCCCGSH